MKRRILISALFFLSLLPVFPKGSLELTYRTLKSSRTIEALAASKTLSMKIVLRELENGLFDIQSPPFFSARIGDFIHIGEIRDARILSALLNPLSDVDLYGGFVEGGNLKRIESPSISPRFSGVAICLPNVDIISFNPLFNRDTDSAFSVLSGDGNVFAALMYARHNGKDRQSLQTDWRNSSEGKNMVFSLVGATGETDMSGLHMKSDAFVQSSWDRLLGGGTTTSWSLKASSDRMDMNLSRKLGGVGPNPKKTHDEERPMEIMEAGLSLSDGSATLGISYRSSTYAKPVYGGRSQIRLLEMDSSLAFWNLKFKAEHSTDYERDFGKESKTVYRVEAKLKDADIKASLTVLRPRTETCKVTEPVVEIRFAHGRFEYGKGIASMELSMEREFNKCKLKITMNQDRMVTASLRFTR